jgi:hypothetical protein
MNDDATNVKWLVNRIERAARHAEAVTDDIWEQDGLRLTGTVMRLDRVRDALEDAWRTLQLVYQEAEGRDRMLSGDRAVSGTSDSGTRVVADILCAAAAGFREGRGPVDAGGDSTEDVAS